MKNVLHGMFTAFSLYSAIPMPKIEWTPKSMRYALCFMPLIGVVLGVAALLWTELCLRLHITPALYGAVATLLPLLLTGGIHMDGFIDTADAVSSHSPQDKKLEILKDSHVGAFGVVFCAGQLLLSYGLWQQLYHRPEFAVLPALGYVASRCLNALSIVTFPTAKRSGLVYLFADSAAKKIVCAAAVLTLAATVLLCVDYSLIWGGIASVAACVYFNWHRRFCLRGFGGNTGDLAGFMLQNIELLFLIVAVIGGLAVV